MRQRDLADMASRSFRLLPDAQAQGEPVEGCPTEEPSWRESFDEAWVLDPSLQPAGEEMSKQLTENQRKKMLLIPEDVKLAVRKAYHQ